MSKPAPFAKLFDTPQGQLLVTIEFDGDENFLTLRGATTSGIMPTVQYTYETEIPCQAAFDAFDEAEAIRNALAMALMTDRFAGQENSESGND